MTEDEDVYAYQVWCEGCGVRMTKSKRRKNIMKSRMQGTLACPMCKKWEWDPNDY